MAPHPVEPEHPSWPKIKNAQVTTATVTSTSTKTETISNHRPTFGPPESEYEDDHSSTTTATTVSYVVHTMPPFGTGSNRPWPRPPQTVEEAEQHHIPSAVMAAAGAVGTLAFLSLIGCLIFCLCKKSRRQRQSQLLASSTPSQEMVFKSNTVDDTRAYVRPPSTSPPPSIVAPALATASGPSQEEPPVLLSTTITNNYYTGIDTSDGVSVSDTQRNSTADNGYASSIAEPPPPYRPSSVAISRNSTLRIPSGRPPSYIPRLSTNQNEPIRSPFDDPEDDDSPISEISVSDRPGPTQTGSQVRDMEEMSDVSELSYQQEPQVPRSSV